MDPISTSLRGLETSAAQFTRSAAQTVRATTTPFGPPSVAGASTALPPSRDDLAAGLVGQMMALASYRANLRVLQTADKMAKATIDLIA